MIHVHDVQYLSKILQVLIRKKKFISIWSPELTNVKQIVKLLVLLVISRETELIMCGVCVMCMCMCMYGVCVCEHVCMYVRVCAYVVCVYVHKQRDLL